MNMDELIIRSLQGRTAPEEEARLREWRKRDPDNERRYQELRQLWTLLGVGAPERDVELPDVDALVARAEAGAKQEPTAPEDEVIPISASRSGGPPEDRSERPGSPWERRAAIGALAAGLVAVGFGIGTLLDGEPQPALLSQSEIVTGAGELTTVTLGDGSSIRLGPESRLRLSENRNRRQAWLEGRAFFGVQADSSRPFTVHTEYGEARVLGTRFEVRTEEPDEEFRVLVVEGEVSVAAGGSEVSVSDGQMSRSVRGAQPSTENVEDVFAELDWLGDAMVLQDTPLDRAVREIERRYGVEIVVEDPSLSEYNVTAAFTGQPAEEVVLVLCEILNTRCTMQDGQFRIGVPAGADGRALRAGERG